MNFAEEVANDIWSESGFHSDFEILEAANIESELVQAKIPILCADIEDAIIQRLMQTALVFSETNNENFREIAQRISTAALRLPSENKTVIEELFSLIHSRLLNFPALAMMPAAMAPPPHAPLTLQYEFLNALNKQTVRVDKAGHVFSKFQMDCWQALSAGSSATLSGPTSAGKSYVLMLYLVEQFRLDNFSIGAYIVPTRALINQVSDDAEAELLKRGVLDVTVTAVPVDLTDATQKTTSKTLYILTQERLEALLINHPNICIDVIVVDEAQMLSEGSRGVLLESAIDRVNHSKNKTQFIFCGPMIGNPGYFGEVFDIKNFLPCVTKQSPVTQNLIGLKYSQAPDSQVTISIRNGNKDKSVAIVPLPFRLLTENDKISYLSYLFGRSGSSIVYAGGKSNAEKIAIKIASESSGNVSTNNDLTELISFVKKHVHKDYALVNTLAHGVGFHYGHMPSLLRKELEEHFKAKKISYLVCTSTLLYGLNLPARNIFLLQPTTGRNTPISGADFWNLSGRAGRLGKELEGNVYLIDYDQWETNPLSESKESSVSSALKHALTDNADNLIAFIEDDSVASEKNLEQEIVLGKLINDHRTGKLNKTIARYQAMVSDNRLITIANRISEISTEIKLPTKVLDRNIGVSIFRQNDLYLYFTKRLKTLPPEQLIPAHPLIDFQAGLNNYRRAFKRIHTYLLKYPGKDNRHNFFSALALKWMRGDPLPVLIDSAIRYNKTNHPKKTIASTIRDTMENVEKDLRFRYVKYFTCYNSILEAALIDTGNENYIKSIPDIALFLEMGGSSGAMINLMALGLSRTSAESISDYIVDKEIPLEKLRIWLLNTDLNGLDISAACLRELSTLIQKIRE